MLSQTPNSSPITIPRGESINLKIGFEDEAPSTAKALVNGETVKEAELSSEDSEWGFEFLKDGLGQYHVEIVLEGNFPDRLSVVYEQDALSAKDMEARAEWDIIVFPRDQPSLLPKLWGYTKEVFAIYTAVSFFRKAVVYVQDYRENWQKSESSDEEVNTTLDDFIDDDSTEDTSGKE